MPRLMSVRFTRLSESTSVSSMERTKPGLRQCFCCRGSLGPVAVSPPTAWRAAAPRTARFNRAKAALAPHGGKKPTERWCRPESAATVPRQWRHRWWSTAPAIVPATNWRGGTVAFSRARSEVRAAEVGGTPTPANSIREYVQMV